MPKGDVYDDAEIREFLEGLPRTMTYSEMADACATRFGVKRAWSRSKIIRYWNRMHPARKGKAARVDEDDEVRAYLNDRLGRITFDQLAKECRSKFGERAPSRSAIHRYWSRVRPR